MKLKDSQDLVQLLHGLGQHLEKIEKMLLESNSTTDSMSQQIATLQKQLAQLSPALPDWLDKHQATNHFGWGVRTMQRWRMQGQFADGSAAWLEGVHWRNESTGVVYNRLLLEDWRLNRYAPAAHQKAIDEWAKAQQMKAKLKRA